MMENAAILPNVADIVKDPAQFDGLISDNQKFTKSLSGLTVAETDILKTKIGSLLSKKAEIKAWYTYAQTFEKAFETQSKEGSG